MKNDRLLTWLGFFIISTVWGSTWLAIKIGLRTVPPFYAAGMRFVVASAVLYAIVRMRKLPIPFTPDARRVYFALGVLSFAIPFALAYWGQQFIPSGLGSILFCAFPLWVAVFSHFMLVNERLDFFKAVGTLLGFVGILIIFSPDLSMPDSSEIPGMAAILLGATMQAYALVVTKKHGHDISPITMTFVGMVIGAAILLLLGFFFESASSIVWTGEAIGSILYLALIGSVLTFVSYYWLLKRIDAVYLSLTSFINPIIAVILGALLLDERLASTVLAGAMLVLTGILVSNGRVLYGKIRTTG
jgi:drug/metabolite transporter (DMT)-like permease